MDKLHVDSITKKFNDNYLLQDVFIECRKGKVVGVLGRNGTGKSTLFQIIFGTEKGNTSYVKVGNKIMLNQWDRKGKIAFLPQYSFLPKNIKIEKLINLFCDEENANSLKQNSFIQKVYKNSCKNLSGGDLRFLETLLILHSNSEFILLDEPFLGLSPKRILELQNLILKIKIQKGIIISDHIYKEIIKISDSLYLLSEKSLKLINSLSELHFYGYLPPKIETS